MDKLVYICYPLLIFILLWGIRIYGKGKWNEECLSLRQMKALQGFAAICIMLHHISQKTCASWLNPRYVHPGLELFVPIGYFLVGIFMFCSGYGLYKSYTAKDDYLKGFLKRRLLPLILGFYTTGIIFLIARLLLKEKMDARQFLLYLSGLQLSNPNTWFVIAMPFFYLGFYLCFRFIKNERLAVLGVFLWIFAYTFAGTCIDHNPFWMRGEWWYNSAHLFPLGLLFAKHEEKACSHIKKHYIFYLAASFVLIFVLFALSEAAQAVFSYYGELFGAPDKVLRRWICLLSQMGASCAFVFFVFILGMKVQLGNRILAFMGTITLEFYLIHGLYVELFAFNFDNSCDSLYAIQNVALYVLVVLLLSVPSAVLLQKLHGKILGLHRSKKVSER